MIGAPMHPHAVARGYSRPAPDPIVAPAQSSREGSAGIRVRARNARAATRSSFQIRLCCNFGRRGKRLHRR